MSTDAANRPSIFARWRQAALTLSCSTLLSCLLVAPVSAGQLAVVVDDLGFSTHQGERVIALPGPTTLAILPFAPDAAAVAEQAHAAGKPVMLHQPMEAETENHHSRGHYTLTLGMAPAPFLERFAAALERVPNAIGVNNHTGSLLTQHHAPMHRLMAQISSRGMFFVDSRTTHKTVALEVAQLWKVPSIKRDVFLDHDPAPREIERQFGRALTIARRQGHAVLIAHPLPASMNFLEQALAELPADMRLVSVADLVKPQRPAKFDQRENPTYPRISLAQ